jgi:2-oxoglutarate dehydrogenase E2 component (dihydrolipoamide succinyltransferase)
VRKLLKEHSLDASAIAGTGRDGRITHEDVMKHLEKKASPGAGAAGGRRVPHTQMRRSIAQHMVQSVATAPHVTTVFEADMSAVIADRDAKKADFEARGAKLTFTAYFVRAAVVALKAVPEANSRWHDDALEIFDDINIGVATALGSGGLIVPVILKAQELDLFGIAEKLQDLTDRARGEKLDARDVQNGTFTISNHGVSGSLVATPIIINQPQSAILGIGKLERRVVPASATGDEVTVRPMCYVSLTIDHRVLDGFQANKFLTEYIAALSGAP